MPFYFLKAAFHFRLVYTKSLFGIYLPFVWYIPTVCLVYTYRLFGIYQT
jgi:hypothetical protein